MNRLFIKHGRSIRVFMLLCLVSILLTLSLSKTKHIEKVRPTIYPPTYPNLVKQIDINPDILKFMPLKTTEKRDKFVNLHNYTYLINTDKCLKSRPYLVTVVHSAASYFHKRALVRSTYGSVREYHGKRIETVFMLGQVVNETVMKGVKDEAGEFRDIVQGDFHDHYRTLAQKHIMGMHWYNHHCTSELILKVDDDTFVNPFRLIDHVEKHGFSGDKMWCKLAKRFHALRSNTTKYTTPVEQYPFTVFPTFCLGFAYLTTPVAWMKLYEASVNTRVLSMDDVYVGILSMAAEVRKYDFGGNIARCIENELNVTELISKPFVFDPNAMCGDLPFRHWELLRT